MRWICTRIEANRIWYRKILTEQAVDPAQPPINPMKKNIMIRKLPQAEMSRLVV